MTGTLMRTAAAVMLAVMCRFGAHANPADTAAAVDAGATVNAVGVGAAGGIDDEKIRELFGEHVPVSEDTAAVDTVRVLPPFEGDYKILIARPAYAAYDDEPGTAWVSAVAEIHAYYKVASFPRTRVFAMDRIEAGTSGRSRRLSPAHYVMAGRRLGATHVIYHEYLPRRGGAKARFVITLYRLLPDGEDAVEVEAADTVGYSDFERGLDRLLETVAAAMDSGAVKTTAFGLSVLGGGREFIEALGGALAVEDAFTRERADAAYAAVRRLTAENPGHVGADYAAALLAGRAQNYERAVGHINAVIGASGGYPALRLLLAEYLRGAGRYEEALAAAEAASSDPALIVPATVEKAAIREAQGDAGGAKAIYESLVAAGDADGRVFFRLALLNARTGDLAGSEAAVQTAARRGMEILDDEYYELAVAHDEIEGGMEKALEYFARSMGTNKNDERAWLAIAGLHERAGNRELLAAARVNLFRINPPEHVEKIRAAGRIYEDLGQFANAKEAYELALARHGADREITLALARIYEEESNCAALVRLLNRYPVPEAAKMLRACGLGDVRTAWPGMPADPMKNIRVSGQIAMIGGVTAGLLFNRAIKSEGERYRDHAAEAAAPKHTDAEDAAKVADMRRTIDNYTIFRNLFYAIGAAGAGAAIAVTLWF